MKRTLSKSLASALEDFAAATPVRSLELVASRSPRTLMTLNLV